MKCWSHCRGCGISSTLNWDCSWSLSSSGRVACLGRVIGFLGWPWRCSLWHLQARAGLRAGLIRSCLCCVDWRSLTLHLRSLRSAHRSCWFGPGTGCFARSFSSLTGSRDSWCCSSWSSLGFGRSFYYDSCFVFLPLVRQSCSRRTFSCVLSEELSRRLAGGHIPQRCFASGILLSWSELCYVYGLARGLGWKLFQQFCGSKRWIATSKMLLSSSDSGSFWTSSMCSKEMSQGTLALPFSQLNIEWAASTFMSFHYWLGRFEIGSCLGWSRILHSTALDFGGHWIGCVGIVPCTAWRSSFVSSFGRTDRPFSGASG